jgi:hypothetical protein
VTIFPETLRSNEVTNRVLVVPRVRPQAVRFFGRSGVTEITRKRGLSGFGALGGDSPVGDESPGVAAARLAGARGQLENAKRQRADCDKVSAADVVFGILTIGGSTLAMKGACIIKWDGAVSYWSDRVSEWEGAVGTAQAMAQAEADAAVLTPVSSPVKTPVQAAGVKSAFSTGSAMTTSSGALGGIPTWVKVAGGVLLLGGLAYGVTRYTKR